MQPEPDLESLHRECMDALQEYIVKANRTCELLEGVTKFPVSLAQRKALLDQRSIENEAHERYQEARRRLFEAAKWEIRIQSPANSRPE